MGNFLRQILALFGAFLGICEHIKLFLYSKTLNVSFIDYFQNI